ncbi:hypothetical protein [Lysobacter enzymogenes]|uniref:hypothetical protein n=1 Tax=Lysobacter enzymogenes TaxID=69 RepID=UPI000BBAD54A|nr:hypothetical protein [Lysobacter enzymogenes]
MIVLDYYDGPLKGFAQAAFGADCCYFEIVAWSRWDDRRLFSVVPIESDEFARIADALAIARGGGSPVRGLSRWRFADRATAVAMDALLRRCAEQARSPAFVCLTTGAVVDSAIRMDTDEAMRRRIGEALSSGRISDLRDWRDVVSPPGAR